MKKKKNWQGLNRVYAGEKRQGLQQKKNKKQTK